MLEHRGDPGGRGSPSPRVTLLDYLVQQASVQEAPQIPLFTSGTTCLSTLLLGETLLRGRELGNHLL